MDEESKTSSKVEEIMETSERGEENLSIQESLSEIGHQKTFQPETKQLGRLDFVAVVHSIGLDDEHAGQESVTRSSSTSVQQETPKIVETKKLLEREASLGKVVLKYL